MNLPTAPDAYDRQDQQRTRAAVEAADRQNLKRGATIELGGSARLILQDTVTGDRYEVTVASGALTLTAL